jgi:Rps23 Pro-64 3,4-dihydroxylase Tpa1-like proline 4-hydroxylase
MIIQKKQFLTNAELNFIKNFTLINSSNFTAAELQPDAHRSDSLDASQRSNLILHDVNVIVPLFINKLKELAPEIHATYGININNHKLELSLSAYNDGDFYNWHTDTYPNTPTENRVLSFLFYYYDKPKRFTGGELEIMTKEVKELAESATINNILILPCYNSFVMFKSDTIHRVKKVLSKTGASRYAVTGWLSSKV